MLPPCLAVCFFTVSHGGSISAFKQVPKPTLISALKKKLRREYNLRSVNLRCSKACKPNSNSNALSILSLDDVALDYDGAIKTYTGSGTDLVIGMEGAALYASSPNALEVLLGEALAKTWANRYNKNTDIIVWSGHALWPPIWLFLSLAVAPSSRFSPLRMAFLPKRFLMPSMVFWSFLSRAWAVSASFFCFSFAE